MLYREIIAVCSEIHTKHINTVCGQNVELLNVKLAVHIVTAEPKVNSEVELSAFPWSHDRQCTLPVTALPVPHCTLQHC